MNYLRLIAAGGLLALLFCSAPMRAQEDKPSGKGIVKAAEDSLETPLPPGAVVRLGTTRFRTGGMVTTLKLSTDGKRLITNGGANGLFVWDTATEKLLLHLPGLFGIGEISPDGERLFVIEIVVTSPKTWDNVLKVYRLSDGKLLKTFEGSIASFALAPDNRTLALEFADPQKGHLELRDLTTGRVLHTFGEPNSGPIGHLRFSPDGKYLFAINAHLVSRGAKSMVRRFDCATGALKSQMAIEGVSYMEALVWNGRNLIAQDNKIWDVEKGRLHWASKGNLGAIYGFMPDGKTVLGVPGQGKVLGGQSPSHLVQWDLETDREIRRLPDRGGWQFVVAPDGKSCFSGAPLYRVMRWDTATGKEIRLVKASDYPARMFAFSPDQKYIATLDWGPFYGNYHLHIWDRATGKHVKYVYLGLGRNTELLSFTPDSKKLLCGGNQEVLAFDTATWTETRHSLLAYGPCELSPDGKTVAVTGGAVQLWDWTTGKRLGTLDGGGPVAFSPDGKRLACVAVLGIKPTFDKNPDWEIPNPKLKRPNPNWERPKRVIGPPPLPPRVQIWDLANRKLVREWENPLWLASLQFTEDGEFLVGVGRPNSGFTVRVWNAATGKEKSQFLHPRENGITSYTYGIYVATNGRSMIMATTDAGNNFVRLWDLVTGKELGQFRGQIGNVEALGFSPDGKLAVSGEDTTVLIVDLGQVVGKQ